MAAGGNRMEILFGICMVKSRYGEDDSYGRHLGAFLGRMGCRVSQLDITSENSPREMANGNFSPGLIHGFHLVKSGLICQNIAIAARLPFIITCTGTDVFVDLQTPGLNESVRSVLESAERVVVPTSAMLPYLREVIPDYRRFSVIPKGVEIPTGMIPPDFKGSGIETQDRVVLLPGPILPVKNTVFAMQSMGPLISRIPNLKLVLIGNLLDSEFGKSVKDLMAAQPWIVHLQEPPEEQMALWYKRAEVVINVSHAEGGCQNLLEAMSLGMPVLASDIPGNRGYIIDETDVSGKGTGFLYSASPSLAGFQRIHEREDFCKRLEFILSHPEIRHETGKRAAEWVKKYLNPELEAFLYMELYRELTGV